MNDTVAVRDRPAPITFMEREESGGGVDWRGPRRSIVLLYFTVLGFGSVAAILRF